MFIQDPSYDDNEWNGSRKKDSVEIDRYKTGLSLNDAPKADLERAGRK